MIRCVILVSLLFLSQWVYGQVETFSIKVENESLESVLKLVSESTGYNFSYNSEIMNPAQRFTLDAEDVNLDEFLNRLLRGTGLRHQVFADQVIIKSMSLPPRSPEALKTFSISGQVLDSATGQAIPGVNVFLSETNIGAVSDLDGYFMIDRVPLGSYEVIFSHLTYRLHSELLRQEKTGMRTVNAVLGEETQFLDTLVVVSRRLIGPKERGKYLRIFMAEFLGRSTNANRCRITNPEVLDFIHDPANDKLEVFALEPIKIKNDYLGYEITYVFDRFTKIGNVVDFYGKARFDNLKPENKRQAAQWSRARKRIYYGSFLHFRRSLISNDLRKQGFRMKLIPTSDLGKVTEVNSVRVDVDDILTHVKEGFQLKFDGFLEVIFRKKPDEAYIEQFFNTGGYNTQMSLLHQKGVPVAIRTNGRLEYPGVETYGYWYWERLGDLLPENYDPELDEFIEWE